MPILPQLLGSEELVGLLRTELLARRQQIERLHGQLMAPFSERADAWSRGEIHQLQLLIQLADRHIELSHGLLQKHQEML
ncbi:MAG: hypothetical protein KGJ86_05205 [Chloroflexota bacterium]|nr:hypothetical protein [Chloroflexota bacterium]